MSITPRLRLLPSANGGLPGKIKEVGQADQDEQARAAGAEDTEDTGAMAGTITTTDATTGGTGRYHGCEFQRFGLSTWLQCIRERRDGLCPLRR
jgi:hypothetical protein